MRQETVIQILALVILAILSLFYDPREADFEGKAIFFGLIMLTLVIFIMFDIYKSIEDNKIKIKLFNEKLRLSERIKNLEYFKEKWERNHKFK
ncbi:hypothetical protein J4221_01080 [Candidatus Pacearchaeota archaeon]|nr:hypothetical protein [Candidatus Pacearchaeota archaeon]